MTLRSADLARLEAASRMLTSPLGGSPPDVWLREAGAAVRDLIGGSGVVLQFPTAPTPYLSDDAPQIADGVNAYVREVQWDGTRFSDPVVDVWARIRQASGMELCSWDVNGALVEGQGLSVKDAPIVMEVLQGQGVHDYVALMGSVPEGEAMVWVLHHRHGGFRFGEQTPALLRALLPSFRAGLDALGRLGADRATLDATGTPLAAFDMDGRELHRTPALTAALEPDPERAAVEGAVRRLGRAGRPLGRPSDGAVAAEDDVRTARGRYTLRRTWLPPGLFASSPSVLVTVAVTTAPVPPSAEAVRERLGLSAREAEVALLLAEGLSNAAVAERLFIAPATARRHTENILGKLAVGSRAAVASALRAAA